MRSGCDERNVTALAAEHQLVDERAVFVQLRVRLRDDDVLFAVGVEPLDVAGHLSVLDDTVRRLDEAEVVDLREARERRDESDVRTFRRLDRAHAAVLRVVNVANLESGALTRESARSERRQTTLVRQLGERVRLIHELRQLRRSEERLDDGRDRAGVDEVVERDLFRIGVDRHALLHQARHAGQTDRELVRDELADRADAAVAEVIDVVRVAASLVELDEVADDRDEIFLGENRLAGGTVRHQALVDLVAADAAEVVALGREEQSLERLTRGLAIRRIARAEQRVDLLQCLFVRVRRILCQRVLDQHRLGAARRDEDLHLVDLVLAELLDERVGERCRRRRRSLRRTRDRRHRRR